MQSKQRTPQEQIDDLAQIVLLLNNKMEGLEHDIEVLSKRQQKCHCSK